MQRILLSLLVIASLVGTTSCKKDKEASSQEKIIGTWNMDKVYFEMSMLGEVQKDTTVYENGEHIEFKQDGSFKTTAEDETSNGTWEIVSGKLKIVDPEDGAQEFDIQTLTDKNLTLHAKEVEGENYFETTLHLKK